MPYPFSKTVECLGCAYNTGAMSPIGSLPWEEISVLTTSALISSGTIQSQIVRALFVLSFLLLNPNNIQVLEGSKLLSSEVSGRAKPSQDTLQTRGPIMNFLRQKETSIFIR